MSVNVSCPNDNYSGVTLYEMYAFNAEMVIGNG